MSCFTQGLVNSLRNPVIFSLSNPLGGRHPCPKLIQKEESEACRTLWIYEAPPTEKITKRQFHDRTLQLYSKIRVHDLLIILGKMIKAPETPTTPQIQKKCEKFDDI
jgi:hypothetical protein